jgi:hypothetical protein
VLAEAGFNPNVVLLAAHEPSEDTAQQLALNKAVKLIDFTETIVIPWVVANDSG